MQKGKQAQTRETGHFTLVLDQHTVRISCVLEERLQSKCRKTPPDSSMSTPSYCVSPVYSTSSPSLFAKQSYTRIKSVAVAVLKFEMPKSRQNSVKQNLTPDTGQGHVTG